MATMTVRPSSLKMRDVRRTKPACDIAAHSSSLLGRTMRGRHHGGPILVCEHLFIKIVHLQARIGHRLPELLPFPRDFRAVRAKTSRKAAFHGICRKLCTFVHVFCSTWKEFQRSGENTCNHRVARAGGPNPRQARVSARQAVR